MSDGSVTLEHLWSQKLSQLLGVAALRPVRDLMLEDMLEDELAGPVDEQAGNPDLLRQWVAYVADQFEQRHTTEMFQRPLEVQVSVGTHRLFCSTTPAPVQVTPTGWPLWCGIVIVAEPRAFFPVFDIDFASFGRHVVVADRYVAPVGVSCQHGDSWDRLRRNGLSVEGALETLTHLERPVSQVGRQLQ